MTGFLIKNHGGQKEVAHILSWNKRIVNPEFYMQQKYPSGMKEKLGLFSFSEEEN